jgi:hypothetical protein
MLLNVNDDDAIAKLIAVIMKCKYSVVLCIGVSSTESDGKANSGIDPIGVFFTITSDDDDDDNDDDDNDDDDDMIDSSFDINDDDSLNIKFDNGFFITLYRTLLKLYAICTTTSNSTILHNNIDDILIDELIIIYSQVIN